MKKIIEISKEESLYVEKLFYEYNASCSLMLYLFQKEGVNEELLNKYIEDNHQKNIALELAKKEISDSYKPEELKDVDCNYAFNFSNHTLEFDGASGWN